MSENKKQEVKIETKKEQPKIEDLPGVGAATAEKLREAGFNNLMSLAVASPGELVEVAGVGEAVARKIINTARNKLDMGFESGEDLLKRREQVIKITTGSNALNSLLGGGVETGAITEMYGAYGSGKTSLAHQLAVSVQLPKEKGGANGIAVWIDSEGTFRPEYIEKIAKANGLDPKIALKNFKAGRAFNSDHQILMAEKIEELVQQGSPIKLVIIDSLMSHFRSEFVGRGTLADRQQKLNKHMHALLKLAHTYNLAIYITNQVMAKPDTFFGDPTEAVGGHVLAHACVTGDALLQLADGTILPINSLRGPAFLPSINNKLQSSIGFCNYGSKRSDITTIYHIETSNSIKTSGEHRFFRFNNFKIEEVEAKDLHDGDYIMHLSSIEMDGKIQSIPGVEHKKLINIIFDSKEFIEEELERLKMTQKEVCSKLSINPRYLRRALTQEYPIGSQVVSQLLEQGIGNNLRMHLEACGTQRYRAITLPSILTSDFAQVAGYFVGDDNIDVRSLRFRDERLEVIKCYSHLCKKLFNISGKISLVKGKNGYQLNINSFAVVELMKEVKKEILLLISRSPKEVIRAFIRGFMDAEGYVSKKRPRISIAQKDGQVLQYLQLLLLRFGVRSCYTFQERKGKKRGILLFDGRDFYDFAREIGVTASDKKESIHKWRSYSERAMKRERIPLSVESLREFMKECGVSTTHLLMKRLKGAIVTRITLEKIFSLLKRHDLNENQRVHLKFIENLLDGSVRWEKIRKIRALANNEPLYDISVPVFENYIANGFVTHNSTYRCYLRRGKKGSRVAKLVDAPAMPDGESIFMVTDEGIKDV